MIRRGFFLLALCSACTHPTGGADGPPPSSAAQETAPPPAQSESEAERKRVVIAAFVTRDMKVSILAGKEMRVVVRKTDGTLVADGITLSELAARDPELHAIVRNAVVSNTPGTFIDARVDMPRRKL
jgi:hypothetical protein